MNNVILLSESMVDRALSDNNFIRNFPEFALLQTRKKNNKTRTKQHGCGGCRQQIIDTNIFVDFVNILIGCSSEKQAAIKKYFNIEKLMINVVDTNTRGIKLTIL